MDQVVHALGYPRTIQPICVDLVVAPTSEKNPVVTRSARGEKPNIATYVRHGLANCHLTSRGVKTLFVQTVPERLNTSNSSHGID